MLSLGGEDVPIDSNVVLYTGDLHSHLDIWDVYRPHPLADLRWIIKSVWPNQVEMLSRISKFGFWSSEFGLSLLAVDKWEVRRDLTGIVLTASSAQDPPYVDIGQVDPLNLPPGYKARTVIS